MMVSTPAARPASRALSSAAWALAVLALANAHAQNVGQPVAPVRPVTDDYFGTKITDPYRWMESMDAETVDWMKAQGRYTRSVLDSIPERAAYLERLSAFTGAFGFVRSYQTFGGRSFYLYRAPGSDNYNLMVREASGATRTLVDIGAVREAHGGTPYAINYFSAAPDASKVGVGVSQGGSEDAALSVYDVANGRVIAGPLDRAQFGSLAWTDDGKTLFLNRLAETKLPAEKYLNSNAVAWNLKDEPVPLLGANVGHGPAVESQQFPLVAIWPGAEQAAAVILNGVQNEWQIWLAATVQAAKASAPWRQLTTFADGVTWMELSGDRIFLLSHQDAPTFKILSLKVGQGLSQAATLLPARADRVIESIRAAADGLYVVSRAGVYSHLLRIPLAGGEPKEIALPFQGSLGEAFTNPARPGVSFTLESWVQPPSVLHYDPSTAKITDLKLDARPPFDPAAFEVSNLVARAKDGTGVPLTLVRQPKDKRPEPVILYAYGSYGISTLPAFRPAYVPFMQAGAATGFCHVRGGGELGEAWRLGGKDANKPNTWRDLIACGESLIANGVTTPKLLFIRGGSAGGITMGRAMEERPDLFAGVIDQVPDTNSLRSEITAGGPANIPEFGTVSDPQGFKNLLAMDSFHAVKDGVQYPPILITTGLNDPRVDPWIPAKFAARLQASGTRAPVLFRLDVEAGHGIGSTKSQDDQLVADITAFTFWQAGRSGWQPTSSATGSAEDEAAIAKVIEGQVAAWNAGDAKAYAQHFAPDGGFTNIFGMVFYGHEGFESRHALIFTTFYKGTTRQEAIRRVRFVTPDVAIVDVDTEIHGVKSLPPGVSLPADGILRTRLMQVLVKRDGSWWIEAYHNTDLKPSS
ncbi:MAG TPA: SgcJ/EcaC family oxidoreductase [Steroidobacteraceae bacterium]|nr:SgcJ/EcaC family oxidoreductase [Steroidobacteraceae bacterium]